MNKLSILYPPEETIEYKILSETAFHDLGFDSLLEEVSLKEGERGLISKIMCKLTPSERAARYRIEVFDDILKFPKMRSRMMELLEKVDYLKDFIGIKKEHEISSGIWDLLHRLEEINDYIETVEAISECLKDADISSEGLINLREYIDKIHNENGFSELKKDIKALKATTYDLKSVTLGINLNARFESESVGLISVNKKKFTSSVMLENFGAAIQKKDNIKKDLKWNENYKYDKVTEADMYSVGTMENFAKLTSGNPLLELQTIHNLASKDPAEDIPKYLDRIVNHMLTQTSRKLKEVLSKYVTITIHDITGLIPEFMYYIRWAEYIEKRRSEGFIFSKPEVISDNIAAKACDVYNLKLANILKPEEIVLNSLDFDYDHLVYILTGANRGGKTTITQTLGQLFLLSQNGIYIPGISFKFSPVDMIYTHFPADEDKTLDLGRLGEECKRFKELFTSAGTQSLLLLNETFSTTSFEEGYYIARDSVKAILNKGIRTIYNTHMHKLGYDIENLNEKAQKGKAASLIVVTEDEGKRSFKVKAAPPEGSSYAKDIALKYEVTYEQLISPTN